MKNKTILIVAVLLLISIVALVYFKNLTLPSSKPAVHSIDGKGFYVGSGKSGLEPASDEVSGFAKTVKGLNEGWENIRLGNSYKRAGEYKEAINAYKRAYDVDPGNRTLIGRLLIETYEKLSRYDEAIALVDEILKNERLAEYGIEKFIAIRTRLLAAKNQASQSKNPS